MAAYFVSRHKGAVDWARMNGIDAEHVVHLDVARIQSGDHVYGTLPVHVAAAVCARGGRYFHLSLETPPEDRGNELTAAELEAYGARLEEYSVIATRRSG